MENNTFTIDDGAKEYVFKNTLGDTFATIKFNATDTGIVERFEDIQKDFKGMVYDDNADIEETLKALNVTIIDLFNRLLGRDVSSELFSVYKPMAVFANGDFYCETLLEKIGEIIEHEFNVRFKSKKAKIKNATKKYIH